MPWTIGGPDRVSRSSGRRSRARALPPTRAHMGCRLLRGAYAIGSNDARASTIASTGSTTSTECVCRGCQRGCQTALGEPFGDLQGPILSVDRGEPAGIRTQDTRIKSLSGQRSQGASGRLPVHAARGLHAWAPPHRTVVHRRGCQRGCHPRREGGTGPQVADLLSQIATGQVRARGAPCAGARERASSPPHDCAIVSFSGRRRTELVPT